MDQGDLQQLWLVRRRFGESRRKELTRSLRNDYLVGWPWGLSFSSHTLSVLTCAPLALRRCASDSLIYPSLNAKLCIGIPCLGGPGWGLHTARVARGAAALAHGWARRPTPTDTGPPPLVCLRVYPHRSHTALAPAQGPAAVSAERPQSAKRAWPMGSVRGMLPLLSNPCARAAIDRLRHTHMYCMMRDYN